MAQNHTNPRAACQPKRRVTAQHHKPDGRRAALKTKNPRARSWLIRLLTKRAGANTSNNLVTYSSIECAACARIRDRKTKWPLCFTRESWASTVSSGESSGGPQHRTPRILPKLPVQLRLFIEKDKSKKSKPDDDPVLQQTDAAKQQSLADDQEQHGNIHRVAYPTIQASDDQTLGRSNWCRCPQYLNSTEEKEIRQTGGPD